MPSEEIADLQQAVAELQRGMHAMLDATHSTLHLLAYAFASRCVASANPAQEYKLIAADLLASIGGTRDGIMPSSGDQRVDDNLRGVRHHVSQFLLTLKVHVEANVPMADFEARLAGA